MFRRKGITISDLPKYLAKGYGQGEGANYQPMIHVQDFPSRGWRHRDCGWKTGRQHDYISSHELHYHYTLDWSDKVKDFREQYPLLPLERTIEIAKQCGIRHPTDSHTGEPVVMTTDFLIVLPASVGFVMQARTIKPAKDLDKRRVIEKFEIERRFWLALRMHWAIVTEREINLTLANNVKWVHKFLSISSLAPLTTEIIREIAILLTRLVTTRNDCLSNLALVCDEEFGLESGQSLAVARHLIASRQWHVDMTKSIHPLERIKLLGHSSSALQKKGRSRDLPKKCIARMADR